MLANKHSFRFIQNETIEKTQTSVEHKQGTFSSAKNNTNQASAVTDDNKRVFLKALGIAGAGLVASQILPKKSEALVMGSTPSSSVVGVKNSSNTRINPATEDTLSSLIAGQGVTKLTISLSASGTVRTPASGKKIRVYASRFSLTADAASVSFRFTSGGTDHEKYVSPKAGGLYGANNHPNYIEGGIDEVLYCVISGTTTVQINIDYLEV
ncbi:MAG: hypothetical protein PHG25_01370 [Candidatus Pacebacteria bacterium]|nr:hypothetical protein [Candidatus Paceibacterota bacterium]